MKAIFLDHYGLHYREAPHIWRHLKIIFDIKENTKHLECPSVDEVRRDLLEEGKTREIIVDGKEAKVKSNSGDEERVKEHTEVANHEKQGEKNEVLDIIIEDVAIDQNRDDRDRGAEIVGEEVKAGEIGEIKN
jgi:hypothetical protein